MQGFDTDIDTNAAKILNNTLNISENANAIATNKGDISTLDVEVDTNMAAISSNADNILSNDNNISENTC